jgi:hypothetical protein
MVIYLEGKTSDRKLRLFAVACCRRPGPTIYAARCAALLELAERLADGLARPEEVLAARRIAYPHGFIATLEPNAEVAVDRVRGELGDGPGEVARQVGCVREVFGNPWRTAPADHSWQSWGRRTIPNLAQVIYDEREFDRLPILADAVEEAGCSDAAMLAHLRGPGPHVRGCWVLDLLLGKE